MCVCVCVAQSCPTLCDPMDCSPSDSSGIFSRQEYWSGLPIPPPMDLSYSEIEPTSPMSLVLQVDSLLNPEPWGKAKVDAQLFNK